MKPNEAPAEPLIYRKVKPSSDPEPLLGQASAQTRIKIYGQWYRRSDEVRQKAKARTKSMRVIRAMRARRKMRTMRKILSNISSMIDRNSILCQTLPYIKYHLVEPVRSFK